MKRCVALAAAVLLAACEGNPVRLGTPVDDGPAPTGPARELSSEACGAQILYFIPIAINNRQERAYQRLQRDALGDYITDVRVSERWMYLFAGTLYCTTIEARAIRRS